MAKSNRKKKDDGSAGAVVALLAMLALAFITAPGILIVHFAAGHLGAEFDLGQLWTFGSIVCIAIYGALVAIHRFARSGEAGDSPDPAFVSGLTTYTIVCGALSAITLVSHFGFHAMWPRAAYSKFFPAFIDAPEFRFDVTFQYPNGKTQIVPIRSSNGQAEAKAERIRDEIVHRFRSTFGLDCPSGPTVSTKGQACDDEILTYSLSRSNADPSTVRDERSDRMEYEHSQCVNLAQKCVSDTNELAGTHTLKPADVDPMLRRLHGARELADRALAQCAESGYFLEAFGVQLISARNDALVRQIEASRPTTRRTQSAGARGRASTP